MTRFCHGVATSTGRVRRVNEDSYLALPPLYAVADGMGGHGAGDLASRLAIDTLTLCARVGPLSVETVLGTLGDANQAIFEHDAADGMGTTITGLASLETAGGPHLMVFNVGDSRVYRVADDHLEQVTVDHSEVQELVLAGALTPGQARTHPRRNIVTRALGIALAVCPDYWLLPATAADRYLLCSDGLFNELPEDQMLPLVGGDPQHAATALVAAANEAGGHDNITVIVVDVDAEADADADIDEDTIPRDELPSDHD